MWVEISNGVCEPVCGLVKLREHSLDGDRAAVKASFEDYRAMRAKAQHRLVYRQRPNFRDLAA